MYSPQLLTHYSQWPSSGAPFRPSAAPWSSHQYHLYTRTPKYYNSAAMSGSCRPPPARVLPHARRNQCGADEKDKDDGGHQTQRLQQGQQQPCPTMSQPGVQHMLDSWYSYGSGNANHQTSSAGRPNPYGNPANIAGPVPQLPPQPYLSYRPAPHNPQPSSYRPSQPIPSDQCAPVHPHADKSRPRSRYSPPRHTQQQQQRQVHIQSADQVVQLIETPDSAVPQPRHITKLAFRDAPRRPYSPRSPAPANPGFLKTPLPPPEPTKDYLQRARMAPDRLAQPKKLLVILDLNGTLLFRSELPKNQQYRAEARVMTKRPGVDALLDYLFANHAVMVCTSSTRNTAEKLIQEVFTKKQVPKLVTIRARNNFPLTEKQYKAKCVVYKDLRPIWADPQVLRKLPKDAPAWDETNTVLLDDTSEKARSHPHSLLQIPAFELPKGINAASIPKKTREEEEAIVKSVEQKLEELRWQVSVTRKIRQWQANEGDVPGVVHENVDQGQQPTIKLTRDETVAKSYPTPESMGLEEREEDNEVDGGVKVRSPSPIGERHFGFVDSVSQGK